MVAVDFNILIGILVASSVLAYVFVLRRIKTKQPNSADTTVSTKTDEEAVIKGGGSSKLRQSKESSRKKSLAKCGHHYGYLGSLPKKSVLPRECLECSKMAECMSRKKPRRIRSKQIEAVMAIGEKTKVLKQ